MRHGNVNRKFGREKGQRTALLKSLARSLILRGTMTTSLAKAKEIRPMVEKMVTRGMQGTLTSRRLHSGQAHQDGRHVQRPRRRIPAHYQNGPAQGRRLRNGAY